MLKSPFKYTNYGNRNESYSIERESFKLLNDIDFSNKIKEIDEDERYKYIFVLFGNNTSIDIMLAKSKVWGRDGSELSMVETLEKLETIYKFLINYSFLIIQKMKIRLVTLKPN